MCRRCSNLLSKEKNQHQPLEGNAKNQGSRTRLAQIYPLSFCQEMTHILLRLLKLEVFRFEDNSEHLSDSDISNIRPELDKIDADYNMTSTSTRTKVQDLPFNNQMDPLYSDDKEVTKLQRAMKQPQQKQLNIECSNKSDSRILAIHIAARRLRYLCIPHTLYNNCIMYNRTIGVNSPLTTLACFCGKLTRRASFGFLPAHRCDWNDVICFSKVSSPAVKKSSTRRDMTLWTCLPLALLPETSMR